MQLLDPWMFIFYIMTGITLDKQFICKVTQNPQLTPTMYIQNVQGWHTYLVSCITWIIVDLTWNDCYYTKKFKVVVLWSQLWIVPAIFNSRSMIRHVGSNTACALGLLAVASKTRLKLSLRQQLMDGLVTWGDLRWLEVTQGDLRWLEMACGPVCGPACGPTCGPTFEISLFHSVWKTYFALLITTTN